MHACPHCGGAVQPHRRSAVTFEYLTCKVWHAGQCAQLSAREIDIFEHIYDAGPRGADLMAIYSAIHTARSYSDEPNDPHKSMVVRISKLRRKLAPIGVKIECRNGGWGVPGRYYLEAA